MKPIVAVQYVPEWLTNTQTWLYTEIANLPADRVQSHVVCEKKKNLEHFPWPLLHALEDQPATLRKRDLIARKLNFRQYLAFLPETCQEVKADLVHSHFGNWGWKNSKGVAKAGCKHVVTYYGHDVNKLPQDPAWRRRYRELFRKVDLVLCEGSHMASKIVELGCMAEKVHVQHLGIDLKAIPYFPTQHPGEGPLRILISASFVEKKGIPFAVEAAGRFSKHHPVKLEIIGDARTPEGQLIKAQVHQLVRQYQLEAHTTFHGYQPYRELLNIARRCHIFLSPSVTAADGNTEGGAPVTIIEMAAAGLPVVSSFHCDIPEVVPHGQCALLAPERDVAELEKHLTTLMDRPALWGELTSAARKRMEQEYDCVAQGRRLATFYEDVVGRGQ